MWNRIKTWLNKNITVGGEKCENIYYRVFSQILYDFTG